jgi:hypothetical protein
MGGEMYINANMAYGKDVPSHQKGTVQAQLQLNKH